MTDSTLTDRLRAVAKRGLLAFEFAARRAAAKPASPVSAPDAAQAKFYADLNVQPMRPHSSGARMPSPRPPGLDPRPDISVVLGSFNRRALLEQAIASTRENFGALRGEIIVIDGGSTDGSLEWLVAQQDVITIVQHNRYVHEGEKRRRMSWGRFMNIAFRAAGADRICMISDDCYLLPGAFENALKRMDAARDAGVNVGASAFYFRNWPQEDAYYVQRTLGGNLMVNHGIYERAAMSAIGYANEDDYAFYKADSDLSLQIWQAGYAIIDAPNSICEHFMDPGEEVRTNNNETMNFDREQLRRRWPELLTGDAVEKMGKVLLPQTPDNTLAAAAFSSQRNRSQA